MKIEIEFIAAACEPASNCKGSSNRGPVSCDHIFFKFESRVASMILSLRAHIQQTLKQ